MSEPNEAQGGSAEESAKTTTEKPGDQAITAGVLDRVLKAQLGGLTRTIDQKIAAAVEAATAREKTQADDEPGKKKSGAAEESSELLKERKARQQLEGRLERTEKLLQEQAAREQRQAKRNVIQEALRHKDAGCVEVDVVSAHLDGMVTVDEETGEHFVEHDAGDGMGVQRLAVLDYVKTVYKSERPSLFEQPQREGGGARGKTSVPGQALYDYQKARNDPDLLLSDEFQKAMREGKVANAGAQ